MLEFLRIAEKCIDQIAQLPLQVGEIPPDFTLSDQNGDSARLFDLRGTAVILVFYPADGSAGCAEQLRDFDRVRDHAQSHGCVIYGVNPNRAASHDKFRKKLGIGFDLLVDEGARVAKRYRAALPGVGHLRRTVYGITKGGRIAFARRGSANPEEVLRALGLWNPPTLTNTKKKSKETNTSARTADEGTAASSIGSAAS